jgi:xylan 1,4-beta-xylosidase
MPRLYEASARLRTILLPIVLFAATCICQAQEAHTIAIDTSAPAHPFLHFWEETFGSGRASL